MATCMLTPWVDGGIYYFILYVSSTVPYCNQLQDFFVYICKDILPPKSEKFQTRELGS